MTKGHTLAEVVICMLVIAVVASVCIKITKTKLHNITKVNYYVAYDTLRKAALKMYEEGGSGALNEDDVYDEPDPDSDDNNDNDNDNDNGEDNNEDNTPSDGGNDNDNGEDNNEDNTPSDGGNDNDNGEDNNEDTGGNDNDTTDDGNTHDDEYYCTDYGYERLTSELCQDYGVCITKIIDINYNSYLSNSSCISNKDKLGLSYCYTGNDYYAGAAEACGGTSHLLSHAQLVALAQFLYNTSSINWSSYTYNLTLDECKAALFNEARHSKAGGFSIWSNEEKNSSFAYHWTYSNDNTRWCASNAGMRYNTDYVLTVCVSN